MDKIKRHKVLSTNLLEHSSFKAWNRLRPECMEPTGISILRENETSKVWVYRIAGVGPGGSSVIAKHKRTEIAAIERTIYEEVLPHLPIRSPHDYGYVEEHSRFRWLFLESEVKAHV